MVERWKEGKEGGRGREGRRKKEKGGREEGRKKGRKERKMLVMWSTKTKMFNNWAFIENICLLLALTPCKCGPWTNRLPKISGSTLEF